MADCEYAHGTSMSRLGTCVDQQWPRGDMPKSVIAMDESQKSITDLLADADFLSTLRAQMFRFAVVQLRDEHLAEDVVQETFAGALANVTQFAGRASVKTWVFSILKRKIIDVIRRKRRDGSMLHDDITEDSQVEQLFDEYGHWHVSHGPSAWRDPTHSVMDEQFWRVFEACLYGLPESQSRPFMMREFLEIQTDEICEVLAITVNNLHVLLFRARSRLRRCLEHRWFMTEAPNEKMS